MFEVLGAYPPRSPRSVNELPNQVRCIPSLKVNQLSSAEVLELLPQPLVAWQAGFLVSSGRPVQAKPDRVETSNHGSGRATYGFTPRLQGKTSLALQQLSLRNMATSQPVKPFRYRDINGIIAAIRAGKGSPKVNVDERDS